MNFFRPTARRAWLSALALACVCLGLPQPAPAQSASSVLQQLDDGFVAVFEKVAPAVVIISAQRKTRTESALPGFDLMLRQPPEESTPPPPGESEGSGFIVRADGYILTNCHVISGADSVSVKLKDGRQFPAKITGLDQDTDVAVLKIEAAGLPVAPLGDSDALRIGQLVCSIGIPYKLDYSFTCGWVSAKGRSGLTDTTYEDYIQTDAFINPGNSGGPLFDIRGNVVGMNTLINGVGRGLAFAIPSNMLREVSDQLIATGRVLRPWLGIRIETLEENPAMRQRLKGVEQGVLVTTIQENAPAFRSELRQHDVITAMDGVRLTTARELQKQVLKKRIGQAVLLSVWREGKQLEIPVTTGQLPREAAATRPQPATEVEPATGPFGLQFHPRTEKGKVRISAVTGLAAAADLRAEDLLLEIDQKPVGTPAAATAALKSGDLKKGILLLVEREGQQLWVVLK